MCDEKDNNCDGIIDENTAIDATDWFLDLDGDGYGQSSSILHQCVQPYGYAQFDGDCDDLDPMRFPNTDADGDGFFACESPSTFNDCDDELASSFPLVVIWLAMVLIKTAMKRMLRFRFPWTKIPVVVSLMVL